MKLEEEQILQKVNNISQGGEKSDGERETGEKVKVADDENGRRRSQRMLKTRIEKSQYEFQMSEGITKQTLMEGNL